MCRLEQLQKIRKLQYQISQIKSPDSLIQRVHIRLLLHLNSILVRILHLTCHRLQLLRVRPPWTHLFPLEVPLDHLEKRAEVLLHQMEHVLVHLLVEVVLLKVLHVCDPVLEDVLALDC